MIIKKKYVLLESLLIDDTNEFDATEKRIFKMLNIQYGNPMKGVEEGKKPFSQWDVAAWLIENIEIPYDMAYGLTKTYYWNYDKLFSETTSLRKTIPSAQLFKEHHQTLSKSTISNFYLLEKHAFYHEYQPTHRMLSNAYFLLVDV